jgi:predicted anti-sigma-YlaC factor YlaD
MSLSRFEIAQLLKLLGQTKEHELNCDECLALVAEFAESQLSGKSLAAGLKAVEQHLQVCSECREEYEALRKTLDILRDDKNA